MPLFVALVVLATTGCVGGSDAPSADDKRKLAAYELSAPPAQLPLRLNTDFDGKVVLVGAKVEPRGVVRPGQKLKLTMYWQPKANLGDGWNLFTHILDGSGERILNLDNVGALRETRGAGQLLGPSAWTVGKVYADEQEFTLPSEVKTGRIQVAAGLWRSNLRLPIKSGAHDRENRAIVAEIQTGLGPSPSEAATGTRVPLLRVDKLPPGTTVTLDGKLDEQAWQLAPVAGPFVEVATGEPNKSRDLGGTAKLAWDDQYLYIGFSIQDTKVTGGFDPQTVDPHLWTRDTAEIMVDPDGDGDNRNYYEIQINPQNLVFDSRFDTYNSPKVDPNGPFGHQEWSAKLTSAVTVQGSIDQDQDQDQGYTIEARIPWKSFDRAQHAPPRIGDEWRMNFYAMKNNGGVSWSAILGQGNFHKASRFGRVLWAAPGWVAPGARPAPSASAAMPSASAAPSAQAPAASSKAGSQSRRPTAKLRTN
jgi:hypothetical protein